MASQAPYSGVERARISLRGTVQGVGMRPYVYNLATSMGLKGYVLNSPSGVTIDVEGFGVGEFIRKLTLSPPPISEIREVDIAPLPAIGYREFTIKESMSGEGLGLVPPDIATCPDCLREIFNEKDRRYGYPFTNCTNCGPRYTITKGMPYDRGNTTMKPFKMCALCEAEYNAPENRRFHAQPNACPECGPKLKLVMGDKEYLVDPLAKAIGLLKTGRILAVKGVGGFHLACDAENENAVRELRKRKRKSNKPFALMSPGVEALKEFCAISSEEEAVLSSPQRPITLLKKRKSDLIAPSVAPGNGYYGVMLPYSPLHHLLFYGKSFKALVMTSGNIAEEPIVIDNHEALERLGGLADAFLINDRDIHMRADDSVVFAFEGSARLVRRSRGYVPMAIELPFDPPEGRPDIIAAGGELKNTFCLVKGKYAIPSQHIGDMENKETMDFFKETLGNIKSIYKAEPKVIAHDLHPDYMTTRWALGSGLKTISVQHHHGHIASCMAENGIEGRVIGIAMDGTGYGPDDGNIWGGEFITCGYDDFKREAHLKYVPQPGGDSAAREPWRMAVSYIYNAFGKNTADVLKELGYYERLNKRDIENVLNMIKNRVNCPLTSSAGRLFDAVSSMVGVCDRATFEAEAAIALEAASDNAVSEAYPVNIITDFPVEADFSPAIYSIVNDIRSGVPVGTMGAKFHLTLSNAIGRIAERISNMTGLRRVALSGGVFQNRLFLEMALEGLRVGGLEVYTHKRVPTNDGGLSLGQAAVAAYRSQCGLKGGHAKA